MAAAAHAAATRALAPAFEEAWRPLPTASRAALLAVARGDSPWSAQGPRASKRAMDVLLDRGFLVRAARGRYRFVEALFAEFVRGAT